MVARSLLWRVKCSPEVRLPVYCHTAIMRLGRFLSTLYLSVHIHFRLANRAGRLSRQLPLKLCTLLKEIALLLHKLRASRCQIFIEAGQLFSCGHSVLPLYLTRQLCCPFNGLMTYRIQYTETYLQIFDILQPLFLIRNG